MTLGIEVTNLRQRFGDVNALDDVSFQLEGGKIYGLLGRNGSGKTTLLSILAAFRKATSGTVLIGGSEPFENEKIVRQICLIRESGDVYDIEKIERVLAYSADLRSSFDIALAERLMDRFKLPARKRMQGLSRGQRSALGVVIGLASRAPLTIFDESYLGMDAPSRYAFYEELLADYIAHPRTIILSTHLIEEVSSLFEQVVIIDKGRVIAHDDAEALRARGVTVTGPAQTVEMFTAGLTVLNEQQLGGTKAATIFGHLDDDQVRGAELAGLDLGPVSLQDLFVHMTRTEVSS